MKKLTLNHSYTPESLQRVNQEINDLIALPEIDEAALLNLVTTRDDLIAEILTSLPDNDKNDFIKAELKVNGALVAYADNLFKTSLKQLSGLIRGRKAVKKYI